MWHFWAIVRMAGSNIRLANPEPRVPRSTFAQAARKMELTPQVFRRLWQEDSGQDIAEYAVMLAVILIIVVGTVKLIGTNSSSVFSSVSSAIQ
jgi:Flp pilus assembly pilin Flp